MHMQKMSKPLFLVDTGPFYKSICTLTRDSHSSDNLGFFIPSILHCHRRRRIYFGLIEIHYFFRVAAKLVAEHHQSTAFVTMENNLTCSPELPIFERQWTV